MSLRALGVDFIGTIVRVYVDEGLCRRRLHESLKAMGMRVPFQGLSEAYMKHSSHYRQVRLATLKGGQQRGLAF